MPPSELSQEAYTALCKVTFDKKYGTEFITEALYREMKSQLNKFISPLKKANSPCDKYVHDAIQLFLDYNKARLYTNANQRLKACQRVILAAKLLKARVMNSQFQQTVSPMITDFKAEADWYHNIVVNFQRLANETKLLISKTSHSTSSKTNNHTVPTTNKKRKSKSSSTVATTSPYPKTKQSRTAPAALLFSAATSQNKLNGVLHKDYEGAYARICVQSAKIKKLTQQLNTANSIIERQQSQLNTASLIIAKQQSELNTAKRVIARQKPKISETEVAECLTSLGSLNK